ncbi:Kinesin-like protein [Mycena sanguinolenta]|uniref:Kinesin-like protein n=1 Tax=Mycena sanguinolenta TaxID=230812 RepID=A0A8H7DKS9_9AGAR|nr:Kinesin-like protein [Mycena sanguinolenta]
MSLAELQQSPLNTLNKDALKDVIVAFRTRSPLPICVDADGKDAPPGVLVVHTPGMKRSGPTLTHKSFEADLAFGPDIDNEEVYQCTVITNDMLSLVLSGGVGCILAYGQTRSGKTFTMEGIEHRVARDLFEHARVIGKRFLLAQDGDSVAQTGDIFEFEVTCLELLGKHASDLLEPTEQLDDRGNPMRTEISVREDKVGVVILFDHPLWLIGRILKIGNVRPNLIATTVRTSAELEEVINKALSHRRTSATLQNAASNRSHATRMLTIRIKNTLLPYADEGQLILVDLAGSEQHEDSKDHDKQRMEVAGDNVKSLMNLRECLRAKAKMSADDGYVHIPWRSNKLTTLLKPVFDIEPTSFIHPHLSYAASFKTVPHKPRSPAPYDAEDPMIWDHDKTVEWLTAQFTKAALKRQQADHNVKAKAAQLASKKLRLLGPPAPGTLDLGVDVLAICPPGSTAKNLRALDTLQFVERCLAARNLFYLTLKAKTQKRNDIMKQRRKNGEAPRKLAEHDEEAQIFLW